MHRKDDRCAATRSQRQAGMTPQDDAKRHDSCNEGSMPLRMRVDTSTLRLLRCNASIRCNAPMSHLWPPSLKLQRVCLPRSRVVSFGAIGDGPRWHSSRDYEGTAGRSGTTARGGRCGTWLNRSFGSVTVHVSERERMCVIYGYANMRYMQPCVLSWI